MSRSRTGGSPAGSDPHRTRRKRAWLIGGVVAAGMLVVLVLAAWTIVRGGNANVQRRERVGAGPVQGTVLVGRLSTISEQPGACAGVPQPGSLVRLEEPLRVDALTVCSGSGKFTTIKRDEQNAGDFDDLAARLAQADATGSPGDCPAVVPVVPAFIVLVQGEKLRPAVPLDRCGLPQGGLVAAIQAILQSGG